MQLFLEKRGQFITDPSYLLSKWISTFLEGYVVLNYIFVVGLKIVIGEGKCIHEFYDNIFDFLSFISWYSFANIYHFWFSMDPILTSAYSSRLIISFYSLYLSCLLKICSIGTRPDGISLFFISSFEPSSLQSSWPPLSCCHLPHTIFGNHGLSLYSGEIA